MLDMKKETLKKPAALLERSSFKLYKLLHSSRNLRAEV